MIFDVVGLIMLYGTYCDSINYKGRILKIKVGSLGAEFGGLALLFMVKRT